MAHGGLVYAVATGAGESVAEQTRATLAQIDRNLGDAGSDRTRILQATVYLRDMATKEEMDACLQNNDFARAMVEKYQGYRDDPLLQGTPTLILDGEALNHSSAEEIAAAIDAKL